MVLPRPVDLSWLEVVALYEKYLKRVLDITVAGVSVVILLPLLLLIALAVWMEDGGRPLFIQTRVGSDGDVFRIVKFRSMPANATTKASRDSSDLHVTRVGKILRRTNLDELPQLLNVIIGEMSLVGPRPLPIYYLSLFTEDQRKRFQVKPGITGLTQVKGGTQLSWHDKFGYDLEYVESLSIFGDIIIILKTVGVVLRKKDDGLKEKPFTGKV